MLKRSILKKVINITGFCISVFMIWWYIDSRIINIGSIFGTIFFACLALCFVFSNQLSKFIKKIKSKKPVKILFNTFTVILTMGIIYIIATLGAITAFSMRTPQENSTLVVLGCQVMGRNPSHMLRLRLETAYQYLIEHPNIKCIVSGGQGNNEEISEAECMYNWLVNKGISADRIYKEDKSTNTRENLSFSEKIIKENNLNENMAIVTDWYHEFRAYIIANKLGYSAQAVSAPTPFYLSANFTTRELFAVANEIFLK